MQVHLPTDVIQSASQNDVSFLRVYQPSPLSSNTGKTGKETNDFISFFTGHLGRHSMEKPHFKIPDLLLPYLYTALITLQTIGTIIKGDISAEDSFVARGVGA